MKKFLVILMASLLVLGLAISCNPEQEIPNNPEQESPNADMNKINIEVENMDPTKAKDITDEQKVVLGNIVADVQKSLESVLNLFASSRGLGEEPKTKMSGSVVLSSAATYQFNDEKGKECTISEILVSYDFSTETLDCTMMMNGKAVTTMPDEDLLAAFVEYLLSNTDKIDAKVKLNDFISEDETVAISGTLTVKNNTVDAVSDLSVSFKDPEIDTTLSLNLSATLAITERTVAINIVNVTAKVDVKTTQATASGTFTLKNAALEMMLGEKYVPIPYKVSVGELSVSVEAPDVASFSVSVKDASMDLQDTEKQVLSVKSVTADAFLSGQVKANAEIKNLVFVFEPKEYTGVKGTFEAIGSLKTPSGYIGAKGLMTTYEPYYKDAVVDFNGSAVTMDSFMDAVNEMMAPEL